MDIGKDTGKCNKHFCNKKKKKKKSKEHLVPDNRLDFIIACNLLFVTYPFSLFRFITMVSNSVILLAELSEIRPSILK